MSSKTVYPEYYTVAEYEKELDKTLKLGCVEYALLFYHFHQYCSLVEEDFISFEKYCELCDFLADNLTTLPKGLQDYVVFDDVFAYSCKLELLPVGETFVKGKHVLERINTLLDLLDERIDIDFQLEVVEELVSAD